MRRRMHACHMRRRIHACDHQVGYDDFDGADVKHEFYDFAVQ
jgi:hypothetical protein